MRTGYGKELRAMLTSQTLDIVIDFCELPVFAASTDPCIILLTKNPSLNDPELSVAVIKSESDIYHLTNALTELGKLVRQSTLKAEGWTLAGSEGSKVIDKIQNAGTTLGKYVKGHFYRGILTGLNEAFVIDEDSKKNIIKEDAKSATLIKPWLNGHDILKWHPDFD